MRHPTFSVAILLAAAVTAVALIAPAPAQNAPAPGGPAATATGAAGDVFPATPGGGRGRGGFGGGGGGRGRGAAVAPPPRPDPLPPFYDPTLPLDKRVDDVMSRLTLEEKVSLMGMNSTAVPRLGIAAYRWWNEALHGLANGTATVFPNPTGLAAGWDVTLQHEMAVTIGTEGRARHAAQGSGLDFWAPNINILRDPRWGRAQETYGEDPYLSGRLAVAFVTGMQGDDPFYFRAISTPKHFAVHSGPEPDRHRMNMVVTDADMYTTYLPQFEAAVREGHCFSIMSAYSAIDGVPDSGNKRLLTDILRDQWGFKGYVVSDVDAVADIYRGTAHHYVTTGVIASALAIKAGNDLNSGSTFAGGDGGPQGGTVQPGPSAVARAVAQGELTEKEVDICLRRVLEARFRMGEFDPPGYAGNPYNKITADQIDTEEHSALARRVADESMVLLKNDHHTLPLKTSLGTVVVMGPNADAPQMQNGNYSGQPSAAHRVTILEGIRQTVGADHVITATQTVPIAGTLALAEPVSADCLFTDATKSKHGLKVVYAPVPSTIAPPAAQREAVSDGAILRPSAASGIALDPALNATMTGVLVAPASDEYVLGAKGRDGFRLSLDGKVLIDQTLGGPMRTASALVSLEKDKAYSVVVEYSHTPDSGTRASWYGGPVPRVSGVPATDMLGGGGRGRGAQIYGATAQRPDVGALSPPNASAEPLLQLAWTKPTADGLPAMTDGQSLYSEAVDLAKKADAVVLVVGIDGSQEGEEHDRPDIELPQIQEGLLRAVMRTAGDKPVVVVNCSGGPVSLNWASEHVPAIVQAWYPGQHGDAVADVLFGRYNPAGRLPMTVYQSSSDLPAFIDYDMYDRTYRYSTQPVLYPFGYGLSYSTFAYSSLSAPAKSGTGDDVPVSVNVTNTSAIAGDEVVECYLNRDVPAMDTAHLPAADKRTDEQAALAATPRKALVGFARVSLKAGESKNVTFTVTTQQLSLVVGKNGQREVRPGNLQIQVGGSSAIGPGTLTQTLTLEGAAKVPVYHFVGPVVK